MCKGPEVGLSLINSWNRKKKSVQLEYRGPAGRVRNLVFTLQKMEKHGRVSSRGALWKAHSGSSEEGMGHFSTVNEKAATEGGDPSPIGVSFLFLLLLFQLPPLTAPPTTAPFPKCCWNIYIHSAHRCSVFALFTDMCPHVASSCFMHGSLVSLSRLGYGWPDTHLWGLSGKRCHSLPFFFFTLIKAAICPWQSHSFFAQVLAFPASLAARSGHVIQSWPKSRGGTLFGVLLKKNFLLFKRKHFAVRPFLSESDTGVKCDIWCSGSYHVTTRQQGWDWKPTC